MSILIALQGIQNFAIADSDSFVLSTEATTGYTFHLTDTDRTAVQAMVVDPPLLVEASLSTVQTATADVVVHADAQSVSVVALASETGTLGESAQANQSGATQDITDTESLLLAELAQAVVAILNPDSAAVGESADAQQQSTQVTDSDAFVLSELVLEPLPPPSGPEPIFGQTVMPGAVLEEERDDLALVVAAIATWEAYAEPWMAGEDE